MTNQTEAQQGSPGQEAREYFPRGLYQPPGTFRFSADALLLACFAASSLTAAGPSAAAQPEDAAPARAKSFTFMDTGTGCGVVGLALCLLNPAAKGTGIDINPQLVEAAWQNACLLGLETRFTGVHADASTLRMTQAVQPESCHVVVTNPPYRRPHQGRHSATEARTRALFETEGALDVFITASAFALRNKGRFFCVYPAERLPDLICTLREASLEPKTLLPVHSRINQPAKLALLEARKNANPAMTIQPPLILYEGSGNETRHTKQALDFCSFLACNARGT